MESQDDLLGAFSEAVSVTLREMAGVESSIRDCSRAAGDSGFFDVSAILRLTTREPGYLILSFPLQTITVLAQKILADTVDDVDEAMTRDCAGEVANVIAGQAKTLLVGTVYHFTFSTPVVVAGSPSEPRTDRLVAAFSSEVGEFTLHLCLP